MKYTLINKDGKRKVVEKPGEVNEEYIAQQHKNGITVVDETGNVVTPVPEYSPGIFDSLAGGFAQGISLGYGDEIKGAVSSGSVDPNNPEYRAERDKSREKYRQEEETNPKSFEAGKMIGNIIPEGGLTYLLGRLGGANAAKAAPVITGIGSAIGEDDDEMTPGSVAKDAALGTAGALLPGAIGKKGVALGKEVAKKGVKGAAVDKVLGPVKEVVKKGKKALGLADDVAEAAPTPTKATPREEAFGKEKEYKAAKKRLDEVKNVEKLENEIADLETQKADIIKDYGNSPAGTSDPAYKKLEKEIQARKEKLIKSKDRGITSDDSDMLHDQLDDAAESARASRTAYPKSKEALDSAASAGLGSVGRSGREKVRDTLDPPEPPKRQQTKVPVDDERVFNKFKKDFPFLSDDQIRDLIKASKVRSSE